MTLYEIAGRVSYGAIHGVEQFQMTRSRGVSPSVIQLVVPQLPQIPVGQSAPLILSDAVHQIRIDDCMVQSIDIDDSEGTRFVITLLDGKWRWAYGQISGQYNTIRGGVILQSTRKSPRELAALCLREMGVERFDASQLPNVTYPEVTWDLENPAVALENLCGSLGCVVVQELSGAVRICKKGIGQSLPVIRGGQTKETIKLVTAPDEIYVCGDATVWEISLQLAKAFGIERSAGQVDRPSVESLVEIDKLSYRPASGWGNEDPMIFPNVGTVQFPNGTMREQVQERDRIRGLATESIWKIFGFKVPFRLPGLPFEIKDINQIELHEELLSEYTIEYASSSRGQTLYETRRQQPFVYGIYYDRKDTGKNNVDTFSHRWWTSRKLIYPGGFQVDKERSVIKFSDAVYEYDSSSDSPSRFKIPRLFLRVAISVKDPTSGTYWREVYKKPTGWRNSTKPLWVKRPDIRREIKVNPETQLAFRDNGDNRAVVEKELATYAQYEQQKLSGLRPAQGTYCGFQPIELDGTIEQVSYSISSSGETQTLCSYGFEHSLVIPSYEERRRISLLNQFVSKQSAILNGGKDTKR